VSIEEELRIGEVVRGLVFDMWVQAVRDGERTVEGALREMLGPISKMHEFERNRAGWRFTRQVLALKPRKVRARKPRGLPSAWVKSNRTLVNYLVKNHGMIKSSPYAEGRKSTNVQAFDTAATVWKKYGIDVQSYDVKAAYYRKARRKNSS
jgi:hypothetical protein